MSMPESYRVEIGRCVCGSAPLSAEHFRDRESYLDAHVTSLCQKCQDRIYLGVDQEEGRVLPIHDGALVSTRALSSLVELVVLPFRLVVPVPGQARLVWEARFLTRAGPSLENADPMVELDPMAGLLSGHQVTMQEHAAFDAPALTDRLAGLQLLLGLDCRSLDQVSTVCHLPDRIAMAGLTEELPWGDIFGRPLSPLSSFCPLDPVPLSTLKTVAVLAMLLMERGRDGLRPLDHLVAHRPELFREPSDGEA